MPCSASNAQALGPNARPGRLAALHDDMRAHRHEACLMMVPGAWKPSGHKRHQMSKLDATNKDNADKPAKLGPTKRLATGTDQGQAHGPYLASAFAQVGARDAAPAAAWCAVPQWGPAAQRPKGHNGAMPSQDLRLEAQDSRCPGPWALGQRLGWSVGGCVGGSVGRSVGGSRGDRLDKWTVGRWAR